MRGDSAQRREDYSIEIENIGLLPLSAKDQQLIAGGHRQDHHLVDG